MTSGSANRTFNLTPSPRVLRMLGQIDFKPWQCLAELIDNSVDAFLSARESNVAQMFPQVNVELSSLQDIRAKKGILRISDNGPGMRPDDLELAMRAGYSGNNSVDKLGLFGMGFNVATARLGHRTEVWTTRLEDDNWSGVRIDFDDMEASGSFEVPVLVRRKTAAEGQAHGTEIVVSKLETERAVYLRTPGGARSTRDKLSRVYNKIMREIGLRVLILDMPLSPREFCVWGENRSVETKSEAGRVPAVIHIDENLGARLYCDRCWIWLLGGENECPGCASTDRLRERSRVLTGWIGIQRYFDQSDYGIDLVRNGRVIEERSKVFFSWVNPDTGETVEEYPIEQQHWGGRIVGELGLDFVPLASHQKDAFDKNSPEWRSVVDAIRGDAGPIIEIFRSRLGFPERKATSLVRLHTAYRRGSPPGLRTLVPGDAQGRGFNRPAQEWAAEFWSGNPEYRTDEKWYEAVLVSEKARTSMRGAAVSEQQKGEDLFPNGGTRSVPERTLQLEDGEREPDVDVAAAAGVRSGYTPPTREVDTVLTGLYELPDVTGSPRLDVEVWRLVHGVLNGGLPFEFAAAGGRAEATWDQSHPVFVRTLTDPLDCLVEELAYQLLARSSTTQREWPLSRITRALREKYFPTSLASYDDIADRSRAFLQDMLEHYAERLMERATAQPISDDAFDSKLFAKMRRQVAIQDRAGDERVAEIVATGEFPRYLGPVNADFLVRTWPELILDGSFLTISYTDVDLELRAEVLERVVGPLRDVIWAANPDGTQIGGIEWRMLVGRAGNALGLLESWRA